MKDLVQIKFYLAKIHNSYKIISILELIISNNIIYLKYYFWGR